MDAFKEHSLLAFAEQFNSEEKCIEYLSNLKWRNGFECIKCGNSKSQIRKNNSRTCNKCSHTESATANTMFHKVKFGIRKAFSITYETYTDSKKLSTTNIGIRYGITEKSARFFVSKVCTYINQNKTRAMSCIDNGVKPLIQDSDALRNEATRIENEYKTLIGGKTTDRILEKGKCLSKNIYSESHTLSLQLYIPQGYLYCFLVNGNIKDRLTLTVFPHKSILLEKRFAFDDKLKLWFEFSGQLENSNQSYTSKEIALCLKKLISS